jgi:IS4 transposase
VRKNTLRKHHSHYTAKDPTRESLRWLRQLEAVETQREGFECIHVMDREGDMFDLMALALRLNARFIIRGGKERALANEAGLVEDFLAQTKPRTYREAEVSVRTPRRQELIKPRSGAARQQRIARLAIGSHSLELRRPWVSRVAESSIKINIVHVWEPEPPKDQDAIEWVLFTTEPIDTAEQLQTIVDHYQARWIIEEFFKALKTGCAFEKRQLESFHALSNALVVFSVVAWRMLLARAIAREHPDAKATSVLSPTQLRLLQHRLKLPKLPRTAKDALYAVARLGGHLKRNGDPGWLTLGRGFERLLLLETGWDAALAQFSAGDVINP